MLEGGSLTDTPAPPSKPDPSSSDPLAARDPIAARLRGFGPLGILAIVVILAVDFVLAPLSAVMVLAWARLSRTPWREIGYVCPRSWVGDVAVGIVFGVALKFLMKVVVMPLLGADPINHAYHYLAGNPAALPDILVTIVFSAGFAEETIFRGYLFERLAKLLGRSRVATLSIVVLTAAYFGALHFHVQGWPGVEQAFITGLVFGTIFAITGRLWMLMWAHVAFDVTAVAIIYWNLESKIAHLIFK